MLSRHQVDGSTTSRLQPWLFQVTPYPEESFSHFLGRFRRANRLSSAHLSAMLNQRPYAVSCAATMAPKFMDPVEIITPMMINPIYTS